VVNELAPLVAIVNTKIKEGMFDFDRDTMMDKRDEPEFESNWLRVSGELKSLKGRLSKESLIEIDKLQEAAYLRTFEVTSHPEISGDVCDDFELLALASLLQYEDKWLTALQQAYEAGRFPPNI
jgi:hypothetical protein